MEARPMLAEIFMLKAETAARVAKEAVPRFVPIMLGVFAVAALRGLDRASCRLRLDRRTRSPGRTLRAVSNHTYTLLGCSTFRYGIKRTTHPLPTEGVIMALR